MYMLELKNVTAGYDGVRVLDGFSLTLNDGERLCLHGVSGLGKTTVLMVAAGLLAPAAGVVRRDFKRMGYVFQDERLLPWLTAERNIRYTLSGCCDAPEAARRAAEWLQRVGLSKEAGKLPGELSGGMQRRVNIARALACQPDLLLLDEAFSFLDPDMAVLCADAIRQWCDTTGCAVLAVSHDKELPGTLSTRALELDASLLRPNSMPPKCMTGTN